MDSNTHSTGGADRLAALEAAVDGLAVQDLDGLTDAVRAEEVMRLRGLGDRLEGQWLKELAAVDARGAAGAEQGVPAGSTAGWLRGRLRVGPTAAAGWVRPACGEPSVICGWSPSPTAPTPSPSGATSSGACGCRRPGRAWSRSTACWTPRPARPWRRRWSPWPAPPPPRTPARAGSAAPTP